MAERVQHDHADGARTMADPDLWAVYDRGQDEWRAAVSQEAAERDACAINAWWANRKERSPLDPHLWCIPDLWPFSADDHVKDLAREMPMQARIDAAIAAY
jgi:hypothetical protein